MSPYTLDLLVSRIKIKFTTDLYVFSYINSTSSTDCLRLKYKSLTATLKMHSNKILVMDPPFILVLPVIGSGPTAGFKIKCFPYCHSEFNARSMVSTYSVLVTKRVELISHWVACFPIFQPFLHLRRVVSIFVEDELHSTGAWRANWTGLNPINTKQSDKKKLQQKAKAVVAYQWSNQDGSLHNLPVPSHRMQTIHMLFQWTRFSPFSCCWTEKNNFRRRIERLSIIMCWNIE